MNYLIWDVQVNTRTFNFGGSEWVVDGEIGRMVYPSSWEKSKVCSYYARGWGYDHEEVA